MSPSTHATENLGKSLHFAATMGRLMLANTAAASEVVSASSRSPSARAWRG